MNDKLKAETTPILKKLIEEFNEEKKTTDNLYSMKLKVDENEAVVN